MGTIFGLPLLFLLGLVSIPVSRVMRSVQKRRYKRFKKLMRDAGRVVTWEYAERQKSTGNGTFIFESETMKGSWYLWWTPEQIAKTSPFPFPAEMGEAIGPEFDPFRHWCYQEHLNFASGKAFLVDPVETSVLVRLFHDDECVKVCGVKSTRKK